MSYSYQEGYEEGEKDEAAPDDIYPDAYPEQILLNLFPLFVADISLHLLMNSLLLVLSMVMAPNFSIAD